MSLANRSHRAALLGVFLLVSLISQNLVRGQLTPAPVQLIQLNTSHYMARCSHSCESGYETGLSPCQLASTSAPSPGPCSLQCCSGGPHCLALSELPSGLDHLTVPEDKLVPTPQAPNRNEKVCATFSCQGSECFKGQKAVAMCPKGLDFCELKRSSSGYTAGCSQTCVSKIYRCHGATAQACAQECCQASTSGSCLQLDGDLHFSGAAPGATRSPLLWSLAGAMLLLLLHSALLPFPFPFP
ncbi:uncharacterized protein AAES06_016260 isoform 2-T2 [Glossophaga mutica]